MANENEVKKMIQQTIDKFGKIDWSKNAGKIRRYNHLPLRRFDTFRNSRSNRRRIYRFRGIKTISASWNGTVSGQNLHPTRETRTRTVFEQIGRRNKYTDKKTTRSKCPVRNY